MVINHVPENFYQDSGGTDWRVPLAAAGAVAATAGAAALLPEAAVAGAGLGLAEAAPLLLDDAEASLAELEGLQNEVGNFTQQAENVDQMIREAMYGDINWNDI